MPAHSGAAHPCDIEIISSRARFEALEAEWQQLFARAARPDQLFQDFNWLWHWTAHFLDTRSELRIIAGWRNGHLAMAWPLVETRQFGLRKLVWMGEPVSQYGDALIEQGPFAKEMLEAGWTSVQQIGADVAVLRKTRAVSQAARVLAHVPPCTSSAAPVLDMTGAKRFDDVLAHMSGKARSSRRRLWRRLEESGNIVFSQAKDRRETPELLIRRAFALKRDWLVRRGRYSPAIEDDRMRDFFISAALSTDHPVEMPIDVIYSGAEPIGVAISLSCKGETLGHVIAHDGAYEKQGIGVVLAEHVLRSSFARGAKRFDMLAPKDPYKVEWTDQSVPVHDWIIPFSRAGKIYMRVYGSSFVQAAMQRLKELPPAYGRHLWPVLRYLKNRQK